MKIIERGMLAQGEAQTARALLTFGQVLACADGVLLATYRAGSSKDSADETIEMVRSADGGHTWGHPWQPFAPVEVDGLAGTLKLCYLTELQPGWILAASMWIDRTTHPGKPLFNAETEGCLPMHILLAESGDQGRSWTTWRKVAMPAEIGPASLTNPILKLADGSLAMSIESNKHYEDGGKWWQKVVFFHSHDQGQSWGAPILAGQDPSGRIFNWDLRCGVAPDGRIGTFAWTYDTESTRYLNIHRRISQDHGHSWSAAEALDITDQAGPPAILPDGRVVLPWVDRFQTRSIRARLAARIDAPFDPTSEVVLYQNEGKVKQDDKTGDLLAEMSLWNFGLPSATALPDGDVLVVYYAGTEAVMSIAWVRLQV